MKCERDRRRTLSPWCITFGCDDCHYELRDICFSDLSKEDLMKVKRDYESIL